MKPHEKTEARRLRSEEGLSVREIAARVGVSKGSVSRWVRDIELTLDQQARLQQRDPTRNPSQASRVGQRLSARRRRAEYQEEGRQEAEAGNSLHLMGCMLYWAEGNKSSNSLRFTNTDVAMVSVFVRFLRDHFSITDEEFALTLSFHLNNGLSQQEIESYWLETLALPRKCLRKPYFDERPRSGKRKKRHLYGSCSVEVFRVDVVQRIMVQSRRIPKATQLFWGESKFIAA